MRLPPGRQRRWWSVGAVVASLLAILGAGQVVADPTPVSAPPPTLVAVASTALVCPAPLASKNGTLRTVITGAVAPLADLPAAGGSGGQKPTSNLAQIGVLGQRPVAPNVVITTLAGSGGFIAQGVSLGPVIAAGTGTLAPGLAVSQATLGTAGGLSGLAVQPCGPAVTDAWFIGGGSGVGRTTTVYLTNVDDQPAQVDVVLFGVSGPLDAPGARGVVVGPRSRVALRMSRIAPGQPVLGIHVVATEGRVSPAVLDNQVLGSTPLGLEYLQLTRLSRLTVIPGVLGGPGTRTLSLLSPAQDALVTVRLITSAGTILPIGTKQVSLQAGQVQQIPFEKTLNGQVLAVRLDSDAPIVAGIRSKLALHQTEVAEAAGNTPLDAPGVVTGLFADQTTFFRLAAPGAAARVVINYRDAGKVTVRATTTVSVAAGTSALVLVPPAGFRNWSWATLTPDPGGGPVYVAVQSSVNNPANPGVATTQVLPLRPVTSIPAALFDVGIDAN